MCGSEVGTSEGWSEGLDGCDGVVVWTRLLSVPGAVVGAVLLDLLMVAGARGRAPAVVGRRPSEVGAGGDEDFVVFSSGVCCGSSEGSDVTLGVVAAAFVVISVEIWLKSLEGFAGVVISGAFVACGASVGLVMPVTVVGSVVVPSLSVERSSANVGIRGVELLLSEHMPKPEDKQKQVSGCVGLSFHCCIIF